MLYLYAKQKDSLEHDTVQIKQKDLFELRHVQRWAVIVIVDYNYVISNRNQILFLRK